MINVNANAIKSLKQGIAKALKNLQILQKLFSSFKIIH